MKSFFLKLGLIVGLIAALTSCENIQGSYKPKFDKQQQSASAKILFIIHADSGTLSLQTGSTNKGQLILTGVNTSVSYFTDRPNRDAGTRSLQDFLNNWNVGENSFSKNPPNAALVYYRANTNVRAFDEVNLTLMNPQYNASQDQLIFEFEAIDQSVSMPIGNLVEATLFIDGRLMQARDAVVP